MGDYLRYAETTAQGGVAPPCPLGRFLCRLKLAGRHLSASLVLLELKAELLALAEGAEARAFDRRDMNENVIAAVVGLDETKALGGVEPLHCTNRHVRCPCCASVRARQMTRAIKFSERIEEDSGARSEEQAWRATEPKRYSIADTALYFAQLQDDRRTVARRLPTLGSIDPSPGRHEGGMPVRAQA